MGITELKEVSLIGKMCSGQEILKTGRFFCTDLEALKHRFVYDRVIVISMWVKPILVDIQDQFNGTQIL